MTALVGGQFGSEGKGLIAGYIGPEYDHHVRVGAANAGHTVYNYPWDATGTAYALSGTPEKHVMQQVPCAAYANPMALLWIGPGALITPEILAAEMDRVNSWRAARGWRPILLNVDARAHVITEEHIEREQQSDLAERIGSTSTIAKEGIGAAQAARVMRESDCVLAHEYFTSRPDDSWTTPGEWSEIVVPRDVPAALDGVRGVLLEGTQGTGLSLTTGAFPYVTSRNTTAAGLAADSGVAPNRLDRVILVCRTFPIRVAGPSGPFWADGPEIEWGDIGIDSENERTTVTKKVRRVAHFSMDQVVESVMLNGATEIALTFCDYLEPKMAGQDSRKQGTWMSLSAYPKVEELVNGIEEETGVPVTMLGTGPYSVIEYQSERTRRMRG